jgi:hypothetical protein
MRVEQYDFDQHPPGTTMWTSNWWYRLTLDGGRVFHIVVRRNDDNDYYWWVSPSPRHGLMPIGPGSTQAEAMEAAVKEAHVLDDAWRRIVAHEKNEAGNEP